MGGRPLHRLDVLDPAAARRVALGRDGAIRKPPAQNATRRVIGRCGDRPRLGLEVSYGIVRPGDRLAVRVGRRRGKPRCVRDRSPGVAQMPR
jgi:hypothetical protein